MSTDSSEPGWVSLRERQTVAEENLPLRIYADLKDETFQDLPEAFLGGGGLKLSGRIAAVLRQFDLGKGFLIPAQLYLYDRRTPVDQNYVIYGSYEIRDTFVPEQSREVRKPAHRNVDPPLYWKMPWEPKDDDIAVRQAALQGADMWMDRMLFGAIFMSGPLVAALQAAGLAEIFSLTKCFTGQGRLRRGF